MNDDVARAVIDLDTENVALREHLSAVAEEIAALRALLEEALELIDGESIEPWDSNDDGDVIDGQATELVARIRAALDEVVLPNATEHAQPVPHPVPRPLTRWARRTEDVFMRRDRL